MDIRPASIYLMQNHTVSTLQDFAISHAVYEFCVVKRGDLRSFQSAAISA